MPFPIRVDCQTDENGESVPDVLHLAAASVAVKALVDRWSGRDHRYFKCLGVDDATYIVRHDLPGDAWALVFHDGRPGPTE